MKATRVLSMPIRDKRPQPSDEDGAPDIPVQLQAVWRLAGGVANDFNNILQVIGGNAEALLSELEPADPRRLAAQSIADAAKRASALTHQLQAVGRRQTPVASPLDLSVIVKESLPELRLRLHGQIRLVTHLSSNLPLVHADPRQLGDVLTNLADHARDEMPDGGTLSVVTDVVQVGARMQVARPWLKAGRFVRLEVADSGRGLDADAVQHLFEPFSTFRPRCGAGLGLPAVYSVIKQSGGFIWVESEPGQGTRITILLPIAADQAVPELSATSRARVLLVEDDESVRELLDGVLMHHGFSVAAYGNAEEALYHEAPFDLLLTDVSLPGINGPALAREIKRRTPRVPILLMSGDPGHEVDLAELAPRGFLQKPFSSQALVTSVEQLLSA